MYIENFSKLSRIDKINSLVNGLSGDKGMVEFLNQFRYNQPVVQGLLDELSENTLTNFPTPYGVAPNFLINGKVFHIPYVTEESSVVAAASKAAKIWAKRGGFHAKVKSTIKTGQVHFTWHGNPEKLAVAFPLMEKQLIEGVSLLAMNMNKRGGGIKDIELKDKTKDIPNYYQLFVSFDTVDAMGANFINSCLEAIALILKDFVGKNPIFSPEERNIEIIMSILSNYNPDCTVEVFVECPISELHGINEGWQSVDYASKFKLAVDIAKVDVFRAVTHNKGIFNGIDAVAIATGNDYRAIEAGAHAFASRKGQYQSLSKVVTENGFFRFSLEVPLTIGTIGGITGVHPLTKLSLQILGNPNAKELMMAMATAGLANHFSAINALITSGIQKGHMKMHLSNILNQLNAAPEQKEAALLYFKDKTVSFSEVEKFLENSALQAPSI